LAANANVFFIEGVGNGEFRRPAVTATEAAAGSKRLSKGDLVKGRQKKKTPREIEERNS
jgi:hypothetical protein